MSAAEALQQIAGVASRGYVSSVSAAAFAQNCCLIASRSRSRGAGTSLESGKAPTESAPSDYDVTEPEFPRAFERSAGCARCVRASIAVSGKKLRVRVGVRETCCECTCTCAPVLTGPGPLVPVPLISADQSSPGQRMSRADKERW